MKLQSKAIQEHYIGFLQTPSLWKKDAVYGLYQVEIEQKIISFDVKIDEHLRLGKYIERFVSFQLQQEKSIKIISENIQIQHDKITIGEIDCILLKDQKPIHLEVIYKFYLYDSTVGNSEIEHCIGPNRRDSLEQKLTKLKEKQLPLLYTNECKPYLKELNVRAAKIEQQVYFKAQLFLPYQQQNIQLTTLNQACVVGFYIHQQELAEFTECKFYIPNKKNWLTTPNTNVTWLNYQQFKDLSNQYLQDKFSPLLWLKNPSGILHKVFLVWW